MRSFIQIALRSKRLLLRPLCESDASDLLVMFSDPKFMEFGTTPPWDSIDDARAMINRDMEQMGLGKRLRLGVERVEDQSFLGICTLFNFSEECRSAEIGYGLNSSACGNGYMNEALVSLLTYGFSELELNRVEADIDPRNIASAKSLERIGFKKEVHLRESCVVNGALTDSALYGLLLGDWNKWVE